MEQNLNGLDVIFLLFLITSKSIRRELRRLNDDRETAMHQIQAANNSVHGAREIVHDIKHKLENRERIERQLGQVQNELKNYIQQLQVI